MISLHFYGKRDLSKIMDRMYIWSAQLDCSSSQGRWNLLLVRKNAGKEREQVWSWKILLVGSDHTPWWEMSVLYSSLKKTKTVQEEQEKTSVTATRTRTTKALKLMERIQESKDQKFKDSKFQRFKGPRIKEVKEQGRTCRLKRQGAKCNVQQENTDKATSGRGVGAKRFTDSKRTKLFFVLCICLFCFV